MPASLPLRIKPDISSLESFDTALNARREQALFHEYVANTDQNFLPGPVESDLSPLEKIDALKAAIKTLLQRNLEATHDGLDMQHAPSSDEFPCKFSFPVQLEDSPLRQGHATAHFSMKGELRRLTVTSDASDKSGASKSISFDMPAIQPPDKGKGKQKASTPADDASDDAAAAFPDNAESPASYIEHDAKFAAALQAKEWELAAETHDPAAEPVDADAAAPAHSRSPSPAAGPSSSAGKAVPASYKDIKPHPYVRDVLKALPEDGKTAYGLYVVLNAATYSKKADQTLEQAVQDYLKTFNGMTPEKKQETIDALCKRPNEFLPESLAHLNYRARTYLTGIDVHELLKDFATAANKIRTIPIKGTSSFPHIAGTLALFTKMAFPQGPFLSDYIAALGNHHREKTDAVFYIDIDLSMSTDISPKDLLENENTEKVIGLVRDLRDKTPNSWAKKALLEWRRSRHPIPIDQVLENAVDQARFRGKEKKNAEFLMLVLPIYQVLNGLTDVQLIEQLKNRNIFNNNFSTICSSTEDNLLRAYGSKVGKIAATDAINEHLTKLQATAEVPPDQPSKPAAVTDPSSHNDTSTGETPPAKRRRLA